MLVVGILTVVKMWNQLHFPSEDARVKETKNHDIHVPCNIVQLYSCLFLQTGRKLTNFHNMDEYGACMKQNSPGMKDKYHMRTTYRILKAKPVDLEKNGSFHVLESRKSGKEREKKREEIEERGERREERKKGIILICKAYSMNGIRLYCAVAYFSGLYGRMF